MDINLLFTCSDFIKLSIKQQPYFTSALKKNQKNTNIILMHDCLRIGAPYVRSFFQFSTQLLKYIGLLVTSSIQYFYRSINSSLL